MLQVGEPPSPRLSGLLTRDLVNGTTRLYSGVDQGVELRVESHSIVLPNVTCGEAGAYMCHLAAPVGEQNREAVVLLTLTGTSQHVTSLLSFSQADFPNFPSPLLGKRDLNVTHGTESQNQRHGLSMWPVTWRKFLNLQTSFQPQAVV